MPFFRLSTAVLVLLLALLPAIPRAGQQLQSVRPHEQTSRFHAAEAPSQPSVAQDTTMTQVKTEPAPAQAFSERRQAPADDTLPVLIVAGPDSLRAPPASSF